MNDKIFWDSNLWIYLFTKSKNPEDNHKQQILIKRLLEPGILVVSVQVLNEVSNALMKKYGYSEIEVRGFINQIINLSDVQLLNKESTLNALNIKERYKLSWYDSLIVSSAQLCDCAILFSEDMQHGMSIDSSLKIINPLVKG
ncbi:MAG: PIN domain-containing protein [Saprospiraceae bacterium]|nr:PIN domain-containing protein [Saprospiraceae bacterium]